MSGEPTTPGYDAALCLHDYAPCPFCMGRGAAHALDAAADELLDLHSTSKPGSTRDAVVAWLRERAAVLRGDA